METNLKVISNVLSRVLNLDIFFASEILAFLMTRNKLPINHSLEQIVYKTLCLILDIVVVGRRNVDGSMDSVETK